MQLTIEQALQQAVAAHKGGNLTEAENIYRAILQSQPRHADANHNLGVIAISVNQIEAAVPLFKTALDANPNVEQFWLSYVDALVKADRLKDAKQAIKKAKKKGFDAKKLGKLISQPLLVNESGAEVSFNLGNTLVGQGKFSEAEVSYNQAIALKPDHAEAHNNLGMVLGRLGKFSESEASCNRAIALKPDFAEAHNNLGNTLVGLGRLTEAEASFNQAIASKVDYADAHNNLGVVLQRSGRLSEAEASYNQAIALKPDFAEAYNNLGGTLTDLGRLTEAEASFNQAIALKPDYAEPQNNLIDLLTIHTPQNNSLLPIAKAHQQIRELDLKGKTSGIISDDKVIDLITKNLNILKNNNLDVVSLQSQIYRRNSDDLNCKRHKEIFDAFDVIPKFCFGCYKVQAEPRSLLELVKLFIVFDQIKLSQNNTRKCMIEMRSIVSGFYKGLVYCSSLDEAQQIATELEIVVKERLGPGIPIKVKRGCSEYSMSFPDYEKINKSGAQPMNYIQDWALIEEEYDAKHLVENQTIRSPSLSSLSLSDVLIIQNWIDYSRGIGDSSVLLLSNNEISSQRIYEIAKTRLQSHPWQQSVGAL